MTTPAHPASAFGADAALTRPGELRSSGFPQTTIFDALGAHAPAAAAARRPMLFDVCHIGVVLRALLAAHGVVAIGAMFVAEGWTGWLPLAGAGAAVTLPAVLAWLMLACLAKNRLARLAPPQQWLGAALLGALCGAAGWLLGWGTGLDLFPARRTIAATLAGAAFGAAMFHWLRMRAQALLPADTTAQLAELQSRIRPHFLFNTLNTALSLVRLDPARAEDVLEDLAELFRVALSDSGSVVTLDEEVDLARRYLAIEQVRFGERLTVQWDLDPAAGAARMPPLLLQPLVENAVRHGVEPAPEGGIVRIRSRARNGRVLVTIVNTVPPTPSRPGNGIALANVRRRLTLMHDVAARFEARRDGELFRVQIVLPA